MDHSNHNDTNCHSSIRSNVDNFTLKTCLRLTEGRKGMLERNVSKHNRLKAEMRDMHIELEDLQQTIADTNKYYEQSYNDVNRDFEAKSLKLNKISSTIDEFERTNQQLQCNIRSNAAKEIQMIEKIKKLECFCAETLEANNKNHDTIQNEKESAKLLKRQLCDLDDVILFKTAEANKLRCVLTNKEDALHFENKRLIEKQWQNSTSDQIVKVLTAECQDRETELVALRKAAPDRLAQAEQCTDVVCQDIATVSANADNWKNKAEKSIKILNELKAFSEAEIFCARSMLGENIRDRDLLTEQQLDMSSQLDGAIDNNCRLVADAKTVADQKSSLATEVERLQQKVGCDRLALVVQRTKCDAEAVLHGDDMTVMWHTLASIENEVEALRRACNDRESSISDAKRKLE